LNQAQNLSDYVLEHFSDPEESLLFFTDQNAESLLVRKKEVFDNVIPASNSIMAQNLFELSHILDREDYREKALSMLASLSEHLSKDTRFLSNWATLYLQFAQPVAEVCVVGKEAVERAKSLRQKHYFPAKVMLGTTSTSELSLLKGKTELEGKTVFYVCRNKTCRLPVTDIEAAIREL
ncbi:MAG: thioredoxin domain-containing protein, partial [Bacteroidota bacterium]